jgi:hypothetical protein
LVFSLDYFVDGNVLHDALFVEHGLQHLEILDEIVLGARAEVHLVQRHFAGEDGVQTLHVQRAGARLLNFRVCNVNGLCASRVLFL